MNRKSFRIPTNQEFNQNEIIKIDKKYNVDMFNTFTNGGKT